MARRDATPAASVEDVGAGIGRSPRDPMDLIKSQVPDDAVGIPRLTETSSKAPEPLLPIDRRLGADESVVWKRIFPLGEKSGVLVGVYKEDMDHDGPGEDGGGQREW